MLEIFRDVLDFSLLLGAIATFVGGAVQGYSGFGGGPIIVPILAILFYPLEAIAIVAISGLTGNLYLWPKAIPRTNWSEAVPVSIAIAISLPLALNFLVSADPNLIRRGMGVFVLATAFILMSGWTYPGRRNIFSSAVAGFFTGGVTGGFGIPGGPFMVVYFMSSKGDPPTQRANIVTCVVMLNLLLLGGLIVNGVYREATLARAAVIVPVFVLGSALGQYLFKIAPLTWFKRVVYVILIVTGVSILIV